MPQALAQLTLDAPYNDLAAVERLFEQHGNEIAAVIVEPVAANMGVIPPAEGFLSGLRELTRRHGALLIFDEVITGFRLCFGGAQTLFGIEPDLTTLGKIIGGGLPVAAYGGRRDLMEQVAPLGPVYQAGTLSGNPLAMRAGIETLKRLAAPGFYDSLERKSKMLGRHDAAGAVRYRRRRPSRPRGIAAYFILRAERGGELRRGEDLRHAPLRRRSSGRCCGADSCSRPRSSRRSSSPPPTPKTTSAGQPRLAAKAWPPSPPDRLLVTETILVNKN